MELTGLFPIVKRWLGVILMATAMAAVIGAILGSTADKTYEAKAQLLVGPLSTDSDTMRASGALAQTYAELATSGSVLRPVAKDLGSSSGELNSGVRATANSTTRILVVRARAHRATDAANIANAVSKELLGLAEQGSIRPEGQLRVLDPARRPGTPVSPRLDLIIPLALVAGLLGSLTLVLLFEYVGDTAESADKVSAATGTVTIPVQRRRSGARRTPRADPLRVVATQVELAAPVVRSVLITGVNDLDGTGGLVLDLAEIWAERHGSVVVIDAGAGEITEAGGRAGDAGLGDIVTGGRAATPVEIAPGLHLLTRGVGGSEAVRVDQARGLLDQLAESYGLVVVHAPSVATSAGALVWGRVADVTVLVARRFHARRAAIDEVAVNLRTVHARLALAILHEAPRKDALQTWSERLLADPAEAYGPTLEDSAPAPAPRPKGATGDGAGLPSRLATKAIGTGGGS